MAFNVKPFLTKEQVINTYEWKIVDRIIKQEFPWITNMDVDENHLNDYNAIFVTIGVDPKIFSEMYDVKLSYLGEIGFLKNKKNSFLMLMFDITYERGKEITDDINKVFNSVHFTKALPEDMKLPNNRMLSVGDYVFVYNSEYPEN